MACVLSRWQHNPGAPEHRRRRKRLSASWITASHISHPPRTPADTRYTLTMSRKRQGDCKPKKLTAYFLQLAEGAGQDATGSPAPSSTPCNNHYSDLPNAETWADGCTGRSSLRSSSPSHSPSCASPAKARIRLDAATVDTGVSSGLTPATTQTELQSPIANIHTSNQPVRSLPVEFTTISLTKSQMSFL